MWATGGFLSDINKGVSPDTCFKEFLFVLVPIILDLYMYRYFLRPDMVCRVVLSVLGIYVVLFALPKPLHHRNKMQSRRIGPKTLSRMRTPGNSPGFFFGLLPRKEIFGSIVKILEDHAVKEELLVSNEYGTCFNADGSWRTRLFSLEAVPPIIRSLYIKVPDQVVIGWRGSVTLPCKRPELVYSCQPLVIVSESHH